MKADEQLNVSEQVPPFSLAICKSALSRMAIGAVLEIRLTDPDTLRDLLIIVERCGDEVLAWEKQEDCYYLWVRKKQGCPGVS